MLRQHVSIPMVLLILLSFTLSIQTPVTALLIVFLFGLGAFGTVPILHTKVIDAAKEAPTLAATAGASAFNLANAGGAWIGGLALHAGFDFTVLSMIGAFITNIGFTLTLLSRRVDRLEIAYQHE